MQRIFSFIIALSFLSAMLVLPIGQANAQINFDFNNETGLDRATVGGTMTATDGVASVTITTVDILAPEFDENFMMTGVTLSAVNGDVETNIGPRTNALGINNPSILNSEYETFGSGSEANDFNPGESWVMEFDQDVIITEFNFSSIDVLGGESMDVTIEGGATTNFADLIGDPGDDFANPFGTTVIPAGTNITFTGVGTIADSSVRITEITLEVASGMVIKGDVDLNGMVDFGDIASFISVLQAGTFQAEADCNCDTVVDFGDIATFISILQGG